MQLFKKKRQRIVPEKTFYKNNLSGFSKLLSPQHAAEYSMNNKFFYL